MIQRLSLLFGACLLASSCASKSEQDPPIATKAPKRQEFSHFEGLTTVKRSTEGLLIEHYDSKGTRSLVCKVVDARQVPNSPSIALENDWALFRATGTGDGTKGTEILIRFDEMGLWGDPPQIGETWEIVLTESDDFVVMCRRP